MPMPLFPTLLILGSALGIALWAWWRDKKPYVPGNPPLIAPPMVLYVAIIVSILMAAHLIGLLTGVQFEGRSGF